MRRKENEMVRVELCGIERVEIVGVRERTCRMMGRNEWVMLERSGVRGGRDVRD